MNDRKNCSRLLWVDVLGGVPGAVSAKLIRGKPRENQGSIHLRGCGSSLSFTVTNDHWDDQLRLIHYGTESDSKSVSKLATFVNRSRDLGVDVGGETARGREARDQVLETSIVEAVLGEEFCEGAFDPESSQDSGCTVP